MSCYGRFSKLLCGEEEKKNRSSLNRHEIQNTWQLRAVTVTAGAHHLAVRNKAAGFSYFPFSRAGVSEPRHETEGTIPVSVGNRQMSTYVENQNGFSCVRLDLL